MREDEVGRPRVPWRSHPWFNQITTVVARVSTAALVAVGAAGSLEARKRTNRNHDRDSGKEDQARDQVGGKNRESDPKRGNDREQDRDGSGDRSSSTDNGGDRHRDRKHERQENGSSGEDRDVRKAQKNNNDKNNNNKDDNKDDTSDDPAATQPPEPIDTGGGGGGGNNGGGGGGGGGNNAGNAGSGFFDSPLATKARRRSNDFENGDADDEDDEIVVDVNPEGESIYETDSVFFATGPDGLEIVTENISFTAAATPTPTPLPALELPVREPGYPFGEDFPFGAGSPFGAMTATTAPTTTEPADPGDTPPPARADRVPAPVDSAPTDTDGGDNTMDFTS